MWNSEKIEKTARVLLPTASAVVYVELLDGLNCYGVDSGKQLLIIFGGYFTAGFMRQFYTGNITQFWDAWFALQKEVEQKHDNYYKWVRS